MSNIKKICKNDTLVKIVEVEFIFLKSHEYYFILYFNLSPYGIWIK